MMRLGLCWKSLLCGSFVLALLTAEVIARDWYVHPEQGADQNSGTPEEMLATVQRAVNLAQPGDTIHLLPEQAVYRQHFVLRGCRDLTIEGNGVTLDGADPLPAEGWEDLGNNLFRRQLPVTLWNRHLLVIDGLTERMGRTQSGNSAQFPAPEALTAGQFCFINQEPEQADDQSGGPKAGEKPSLPAKATVGWLYVRGATHNLEWAVRPNGLATAGKNSGIVVRNLNARHALNDGFNIHGESVDLTFENIQGYDCFDEGFSAHDLCRCTITDGKFWGNENAVADVNDCETHYRNCEFRDSVSFDVLLIGRKHSLTDCVIRNTTPATALAAGPRGLEKKLFQLRLERVSVQGKTAQPARMRVDAGQLELIDCRLENAQLDTTGAYVEEQNTQIISSAENAAPSQP